MCNTATSERSSLAANWLTSLIQPWCAAQQPRSPPSKATNKRNGGARTTRRHDDVAIVPARDLLKTTARSGRATNLDVSVDELVSTPAARAKAAALRATMSSINERHRSASFLSREPSSRWSSFSDDFK